MRAANGEGNWAAWKIEHIAAQRKVLSEKRAYSVIEETRVDEILRCSGIFADTKGIERGRRIGIKQGNAQIVVIDGFSRVRYLINLVPANACLPFPGLELVPGICKFSEVSFYTSSEQVIFVGVLNVSRAEIVVTTEFHAGRKFKSRRRSACLSARNRRIVSADRGVIRNRERIKRILRGHTNANGTDERRVSGVHPRIRHKRRG